MLWDTKMAEPPVQGGRVSSRPTQVLSSTSLKAISALSSRCRCISCAGVWRCSDRHADVVEIRLALRCLLPHCPERWPLELYWDAAAQENEIGRAQGVTAAFNGIVRQLRRAGCYEEVTEP